MKLKDILEEVTYATKEGLICGLMIPLPFLWKTRGERRRDFGLIMTHSGRWHSGFIYIRHVYEGFFDLSQVIGALITLSPIAYGLYRIFY